MGDVKRFVDKSYFEFATFAVHDSGIAACCPKCGGLALVTLEDDTFWLRCTSCGKQQHKSKYEQRYAVHAQCGQCGRYFRTDIDDTKNYWRRSSLCKGLSFCYNQKKERKHERRETLY
jgi:bacterioferritin-associated ferredoxin